MSVVFRLTVAQLRMYLRDRMSVFLSLFFPLMLMFALGYMVDGGSSATRIALVGNADAAPQLVSALKDNSLLDVRIEDAAEARAALKDGHVSLILDLPERMPTLGHPVDLKALVNAGNPQGTAEALTIVRGVLSQLDYAIRGAEPLFTVTTEDLLSRHLRYVDFLIPGILAFMVMQLAITGSGFNIVEYKRKGILKRLFVTPLMPLHFVASLIAMRLVTILVQLSILLAIAFLAFHITIQGSLLALAAFVIAGGIMFLGIGFALGGFSSSQNAVILLGNLVILPQTFLAGVFFPLDSLPGWLRSIAYVLPLNFVSDAIRRIANDGAGFPELGLDMFGIAAWTAIGLVLAVRFFRWSDAANS